MTDEPSDIAARINAKRAETVAPRGEVPQPGIPADDGGGIAASIDRLRELRVRTPRANDLGSAFAARGKQLQREARGTGTIAKAWGELCPAHLLGRTGVVGVTRGVLTLAADDAAARFEVDRVLRCGVERQLLRKLSLDVRRVRVVVVGEQADNPAESGGRTAGGA